MNQTPQFLRDSKTINSLISRKLRADESCWEILLCAILVFDISEVRDLELVG
jgi:hypothetical protein